MPDWVYVNENLEQVDKKDACSKYSRQEWETLRGLQGKGGMTVYDSKSGTVLSGSNDTSPLIASADSQKTERVTPLLSDDAAKAPRKKKS